MGGPPRRSRGRTVLIVLAVIVVIILVIGVVGYLLAPPMANIQVTAINFYSADDVCGLNGASSDGFNTSSGQAVELSFAISGNNTTNGGTAACEIQTISTTTPGFGVSGANVPLTVPANSSPTLSFSVSVPSGSYTGVLTLNLT
jgi:hypothetical protein